VAVSAAEPTNEFVKATGTSFSVNGKPFFVSGVNNHYLIYGTDTEVKEVLDDAVALGANVIRTFLTPVIGDPDDDRTTIWTFHNPRANTSDGLNVHGNFLLYWDKNTYQMAINEGPNGMQKVDVLITEAKHRHLQLIIALLDFWDFTGGIQQMTAWYNKNYVLLPFIKDTHARDDYFFFTDPRAIRDYQNWVRYVVNRLNRQTGLRYRDDPTIMAWDVTNEANAKPDNLRLAWTQAMAAYIKQEDPNHLVTSGNANIDLNTFDISLPGIDFGTWHGYPKYLGIGVEQFDNLIRRYCEVAVTYQKPVLLEEFGWARSNPNQAAAYTKWLDTISENSNCAGSLVWRLVSRQYKGGYPRDEYDQFDVRKDDPALWKVIHEAATRGRADAQ
jgi:mannan endo-1,4-beta-mannosidase